MVMLISHGMKTLRGSSLLLTSETWIREPRLLKLFSFPCWLATFASVAHSWFTSSKNVPPWRSASCGTPSAVIYFAVIRQSPIDIIRNAFPSHLRLQI
jgi:hypothetical protein